MDAEVNLNNNISPINTNPDKIRNHGERGEMLVLALLLSKQEFLFLNGSKVRYLAKARIKDQTFSVVNDKILIQKESNTTEVELSDLKNILNKYLSAIKTKKVKDLNELKSFLLIDNDKSSSFTKQDIEVLFSDSEQWEGYSVKTFTGANPTLFNASRKAVFLYSLPYSGNLNTEEIKNKKFIKDKINSLMSQTHTDISQSVSLGVVDSPLNENLDLINSDYSKKFGSSFLKSFLNEGKSFADNFRTKEEQDFVKEFLWMSCLGMVPSKIYNMDNGSNCGLILFDGTFLYIFKDGQELKDFLFNHAKFDSPSTKRYPMVSDFKQNGSDLSFGITLQIRLSYPRGLFNP